MIDKEMDFPISIPR